MGFTIYRQPCGCEVTVSLDYDGSESADVEYCPRHAAADAMYEAIDGLLFVEGLLPPPPNSTSEVQKAHAAFTVALIALDLADGEKDS